MSTQPYEIAAYYFPQYHADPRNNSWHGYGWTEWELVKAARPRFPSHQQPIVPAWGYFDESDPTWVAREIDLAANHGLTTFLYDWYWYEDGPFLHDALNRGFLNASNQSRLKFALMWANHDWLDIHPALFSNRPTTLASGHLSHRAFEKMTNYVIEHYFARPNYLTVDEKPYFSLYEIGNFITSMGGMDAACAALEDFRYRTQAAGLPNLHLNAIVWGLTILPSEMQMHDPASIVSQLGFDSATSYAWTHHYLPDNDTFPHARYQDAAHANYKAWQHYADLLPVPYYPNVSMGWDPSPRTVQSDVYEARGYPWTSVYDGNTAEVFRDALEHAKAFLDNQKGTPKMVTLNAWNEWTEGSYLLPDTVHGTAYLEAIQSVFGTSSVDHSL